MPVDDRLISYPHLYRFSSYETGSIASNIQPIFFLSLEARPKIELKSMTGYSTFLKQKMVNLMQRDTIFPVKFIYRLQRLKECNNKILCLELLRVSAVGICNC